jgi:hypothetical protein
MDVLVMFHETERLAREDKWEDLMPTEFYLCPGCKRSVKITAKEDEVVEVTCKKCGKTVQVVIKSRRAA